MANAVPTPGAYPLKHNKREAKVIETARQSLQTSVLADGKILVGNASNVATAVTPSGDATVSNAGAITIGAKKVTAAKVALADGKVLIGDATGAAAEQTISGDITISNAGVAAIGATKVLKSMLSANVAADWKVAVVASGVTGSTVIGVLINDICIKVDTVGGSAGLVTWALAVADNTVPQTLAPGDLAIILRSVA